MEPVVLDFRVTVGKSKTTYFRGVDQTNLQVNLALESQGNTLHFTINHGKKIVDTVPKII